MKYREGNLINTEYGIMPIKNVVFNSYQVKGKDGRLLWANKIEPVELTEEWLTKKAGFKSVNGYVYLSHDALNLATIQWDEDRKHCYLDFEGTQTGMDIKYAHHLQNVFEDLTGTELTLI